MAIPSDHLELSARLASHHRRRRPPAPRRARRGRWGARRRGSRLGRGRAFLGGVDARWQRSTVKASYSRNGRSASWAAHGTYRSEEHTSELQSHLNLVCRLLLEKKKI